MPERQRVAWARAPALVMLFALLLAPSAAEAHKLKAFAFVEGTTIRGLVFFGRSAPAQGVSVVVSAADGTLLAKTATDPEGRFSIDAQRRIDHHIAVDAGDGHAAEYVVTAAELPPTLPGGEAEVPWAAVVPVAPAPAATMAGTPDAEALAAIVEAAVARQLGPLREQLAVFEEQVLLRDVLGGLGYIVGLTGLILWLRAHRSGAGR